MAVKLPKQAASNCLSLRRKCRYLRKTVHKSPFLLRTERSKPTKSRGRRGRASILKEDERLRQLITLLIGLRSHWLVEVRRHHETWCVRHVVVGHQVIHVLILLQVVLHSSTIRIVNGLKTTIILFVVWSLEDVPVCHILLGRGFHVVFLFYSFTVLTRATFKGLLG